MPGKALVAFGIMLGIGLFALSVPGGFTEANAFEHSIRQPADTDPEVAETKSDTPIKRLPILSIENALTRALKENPKLAAFSQEIRARESEAFQAGLRPNPEVSVEVENVAGTGDFSGTDRAETTFRLSQPFELGGKRAKRFEVGQLDRQLAEQEYEIARADVLSETTERFIAVLAAQKRLALAEEQVRVTEKVLQTVEERIETGKTAAVENIRFQTLLAEASLLREKTRQNLAAARLALATAWGSREADFEAVQGRLEVVGATPEWSDLASRIDQSPLIRLQKTETRMGDRIYALERANRIPDLTVSLGIKSERETEDQALVAEIALPLPVFDRNQGGIAAARARKKKALEAAEYAQFQLRAQLAGSWQKLQAASSEVAVLHDKIIPASQKTFDAVAYGYQAGKYGFLEVLDAEQTLFEARSRYIDALETYHRAVSEVERLLGQTLFPEEGLSASSTQ